MLLEEMILPIPGFEGYYASNDGRIWSTRYKSKTDGPLRQVKAHPVRIAKNKSGPLKGPYWQVALTKKVRGRCKRYMVHRLVLLTFEGECPDGHEGCHADGDPANNAITNLYWGTKQENVEDALRHGSYRQGERKLGAKLNASKVRACLDLRKCGWTFAAIASLFGVSATTVSKINAGKKWKCVSNKEPKEYLGNSSDSATASTATR